MTGEALRTFVRIVLSLVFMLTGFLKTFSFTQFQDAVQQYSIIPDDLLIPFSVSVIVGELFIGFGLLFNHHLGQFSLLGIALLSFFTIAMLFNIVNDNLVDCGCYGGSISGTISWPHIGMNIVLILLLYWIGNPHGNGTTRAHPDHDGQRI